MSQYADRHRSLPECIAAECEAPGTVLVLVAGKPQWVCPDHKPQP